MAATIQQLENWLSDYPGNWTVFIDKNELTICVTSPSGSITSKFELGDETFKFAAAKTQEDSNNNAQNRRN